MKVLSSKPIELQRVKTKSGAELWKIQLEGEGNFLLEQNPKKDGAKPQKRVHFWAVVSAKKGGKPRFLPLLGV